MTRRLASGVLASIGVLAALGSIEIACKVVDVAVARREHRELGRVSRPSEIPGVRYEMLPNVVSRIPGQLPLVRINNLGFRGRDVEVPKPTGAYRIVVLGDSIAFGKDREEEEIFPSILERRLRRSAPRVEVVNASLNGRDTWEEAALLRHRVLAIAPDLVILQICLNDHVQLPFPRKDARFGVFHETDRWWRSSLLALLDRRVPGFARIHETILEHLGLAEPGDYVIRTIPAKVSLQVAKHWPEWSRALLDIRDLAAGHHVDLLFVAFPMLAQIEEGAPRTLPLLDRFAAENGIAYLDLMDAYREADGPLFVRNDSVHPNPKGHRLAGKTIAGVVRDRFLHDGAEPSPRS